MAKKHLNRRWKDARQQLRRDVKSPWMSWRDSDGGISVEADAWNGNVSAFIPIAQLRSFIERYDREG